MTVLVALQDKRKKLYLAADRQVSGGNIKYATPTGKVVKVGEYLLGFCGDAYIGHVCASLPPPPTPPSNNLTATQLYAFMNEHYLSYLIKHLRRHHIIDDKKHHLPKEVDAEKVSLGLFVGLKNFLFTVDIDDERLVILPLPIPQTAGCGDQLALGAISIIEELSPNLPIKEKFSLVFNAVHKHDLFCGKEFDIIS